MLNCIKCSSYNSYKRWCNLHNKETSPNDSCDYADSKGSIARDNNDCISCIYFSRGLSSGGYCRRHRTVTQIDVGCPYYKEIQIENTKPETSQYDSQTTDESGRLMAFYVFLFLGFVAILKSKMFIFSIDVTKCIPIIIFIVFCFIVYFLKKITKHVYKIFIVIGIIATGVSYLYYNPNIVYQTYVNFTKDTSNEPWKNTAFLNINSFRGKYYKVFDSSLIKSVNNWEDAAKFCQKNYGQLAVIESHAENRFIYNWLNDNEFKDVYFGLTDKYNEGKWYSLSKGKAKYLNWAPGEPNNEFGVEHYAMFYHKSPPGFWNDGIPGKKFLFICQWDNERFFENYKMSILRGK